MPRLVTTITQELQSVWCGARARALIVAFVAAALASLIAVPVSARTTHFVIEFSQTHECTHEQVSGDTRVTLWMDTTDNGDGTTTVTTRQHVHGSDLRGAISGDKYVINERSDNVETFVIATTGGTITTKTTFIHYTERQAFTEVPGQDDLHQYLSFLFGPVGDPILTEERTECR
jgi:hypothetical protein